MAKVTGTGLAHPEGPATGASARVSALAVALAACSGSSIWRLVRFIGNIESTAKPRLSMPAITWAEQPASAPNCIFPLGPLTCETVANAGGFQNLMYRPLYWLGNNGSLSIDQSLSLANPPVWNSTDTALTITLKPYKWSNGSPLTARDVVFFYDLSRRTRPSGSRTRLAGSLTTSRR